jgi:predicted outer membrane protein
MVDAAVPDAAAMDTAMSDAAADAPVAMDAGPTDARGPDAVADAAPPPMADAASDAAQPLNDPEIVGIIENADTDQILQAMLATGNPDDGSIDIGLEAGAPVFDAGGGRSSNASVIGYANMIAIDNAQVNASLDSFGIAPAPSQTLMSVQNTDQGTMSALTPLTGPAFDMAYAQNQVAAQTSLRDLVANRLAPAATDPQLQMYLTGTLVPLIQVHVLAAQALVSQVADGGGVPTTLPVPLPVDLPGM